MEEKNKTYCSICGKAVADGGGAILTVTPFGAPRYLCDECDGEFATITGEGSEEEIALAVENVKKKLISRNVEDKAVLDAVADIINGEDGEDENEDGQIPEQIPEELLETEEDRALDTKEKEINQKIDKIFNWITTGVAVAVLALVIFWIIKTFL